MAKAKGAAYRTTAQRLADAELHLNRLREKNRKEDTRRKILVGAMMLAKAENSPQIRQQLLTEIDNRLATGHRDRRLFIDYGIGPIRGLYGATLHPAEEQPPGWAEGLLWKKKPLQRSTDRYGNVIGAS
jgi:hypothetical protein|uniref:MobS/MobC n=1 Tax=Halomonas sp. Ant2 TaxID=1630300 RepID=A0A0D5MCD1_9GAMM|nr:hypothetical protein [Halomonas sp. Ant2]AJY53636.1 MobS/MobC [Halomonas sp. Ant2]